MKRTSKILVLTLYSLLILNLMSCNTASLWQKEYSYTETAQEFLITNDGNKIIILGEKYHYILDDNNGVIKKILTWDKRSNLKMTIYDLEVIKSNKVIGSVMISTDPEKKHTFTKNEIKFFDELEFSQPNFMYDDLLEKQISINGTRYLPKPGVNYETHSSLNKRYKFEVKYDDNIKKAALTPVFVAADGLGVALGAAMFVIAVPLVIPVMIIVCVKDPGGACS